MIFDLAAIEQRAKALPGESAKIFLDSLKKLVEDNKDDIRALPGEVLTALLSVHLMKSVEIPEAGDDDPDELQALQLKMIAIHSAQFKVIAALQQSENERISRLEDNVKSFALKVGPAIGAIAIKVLMG